jgi:hypothetical protein
MPRSPIRIIRITRSFLERAAKAKALRPCSATVRRGTTYATVAYRDWSDHYDIFANNGRWLASFTDSSLGGQPRFENLFSAAHVRVHFPV